MLTSVTPSAVPETLSLLPDSSNRYVVPAGVVICEDGSIAIAWAGRMSSRSARAPDNAAPRARRDSMQSLLAGSGSPTAARVVVGGLAGPAPGHPADAKVVIAGRAVRNHDGRFGRWIPSRPGVTHIRIAARAPGYIGDPTEVAVRRAPASPARKQQ